MSKKNVYYLVNPVTASDEEERFPEFYRSRIRTVMDFTAISTKDDTTTSYPDKEK